MTLSLRFPSKDAGDTLDYTFDLSDWLQSGESISTVFFSVSPTDMSQAGNSFTSTSATVWLAGGTINVDYKISLVVTTNSTPTSRVSKFTAGLTVTDQ